MKSNYKIFTAVFLSAIMTAAAPLTVCGAEVFSAGESFSDGTGSIRYSFDQSGNSCRGAAVTRSIISL